MSRVVVFGIGPMRWEQSTRLFALPLRTWHFAAALARDRHEVLLFSIRTAAFEGWPTDKVTLVERNGVRVYSISEYLAHERPDWIEAKIRAFAPDCIVGVNKDPAAIAVNFARGLPFWADVNGDPMAEAQSKAQATGSDALSGEFYRRFVPVLQRGDVFSTCSRAQRSALIGQLSMVGRLTGPNAGYELVHAVPNSVDDEDLALLGGIDRRLRRVEDPFVLLWSGGYNTWCDPELLVDGLERAMTEDPRLRFVSTGGGIGGHYTDGFDVVRRHIERSPHRGRYHLAGWVQTAELPAYYADAHAAVLTDRFGYEGVLGARTRMLDWLAAGLPIVTTRLSEISLDLEAEGAALGCECGDAEGLAWQILRLVRDPGLALEIGEKGRRHASAALRSGPALRALRAWAEAPRRAPDTERRIELPVPHAPGAELGSLARQLASRTRESGLRAGLKDVRRFALRRARHRVQRVLDAAGLPGGVEVIELARAEGAATEAPRLGALQWQRRIGELGDVPRVAVVVLVRPDDDPEVLDWTLEQIARQYYDAWSILVVLGGPTPLLDARLDAIGARFAANERPLTLARADRVDPLCHAIVQESAFTMVIGVGDLLRPDALAELVTAARQQRADVVYADEQDVDETNAPRPVRHKPAFSGELLLALPFLGAAVMMRSALLETDPKRLASWPSDAIVHDLVLRATDEARVVRRVPRVLCQRYRPLRRAPEERLDRDRRTSEACLRALEDALWRRGLRASAERGTSAGTFRVRYELPEPADVVLAVPAEGSAEQVARCMRSLEERNDHAATALVLALGPDAPPPPEGAFWIARAPRARTSSAAIDVAIRQRRSHFVGWVLPEVEALRPGWLEELVRQAGRPEVGAVAPRLVTPDGQRAWPAAELAPHVQELTRLTAACVVMRREAYLEAGGLAPDLPPAQALETLSTRLVERGLALLYTPHASLYLHARQVPEQRRA